MNESLSDIVWSGEIRRRCKVPNIEEKLRIKLGCYGLVIRWDRGEPSRDIMEHKENGKVKEEIDELWKRRPKYQRTDSKHYYKGEKSIKLECMKES